VARITFGEPSFVSVKRVIEFELHGVAFIEGYERSVGFEIESLGEEARLGIEDMGIASKEMYDFFNATLKPLCKSHEGLRKSLGTLCTGWSIPKDHLEEMISKLGEAMGSGWQEALRKIMFRT